MRLPPCRPAGASDERAAILDPKSLESPRGDSPRREAENPGLHKKSSCGLVGEVVPQTKQQSLLSPEQREIFEPGPGLIERRISDSGTPSAGESVTIESIIADALSTVSQPGSKTRTVIIAVDPRDGMTWAAESARRALESRARRFGIHLLSSSLKRSKPAPEIAHSIGTRRFWSSARRAGLLPGWSSLLKWYIPAAAIIAATFASRLMSSQVLIAASVMAIVVVPLLQRAAARLDRAHDATSRRHALARALRDPVDQADFEVPIDAWNKLGADLARRLKSYPDYPRAFVMDGFDEIDATTREVVVEYLRTRDPAWEVGAEIWIVFESSESLGLSRQLGADRNVLENCGATFHSLKKASDTEKEALVRHLGRPSTALRFRAIGDVARGVPAGSSRLALALESARKDFPAAMREFGPVELLGLFSVAADAHHPGYLPHDIVSALARKPGPPGEAGSQPGRRRLSRIVLASYLRRTDDGSEPQVIGRQRVQASLRQLCSDLAPLVDGPDDDNRGGRFRVPVEVASVVVADPATYDLSPNTVGHLFWALYLYENLINQPRASAFWVRRLADHAIAARVEAGRVRGLDDELSATLLDGCLFALDQALSVGAFGKVIPLIRRCNELVEDLDLKPGQSRLVKFAEVAWTAFLATGEDEILHSIVELQSDSEGDRVVERDPVLDLYVGTMSLTDRERKRLQSWISSSPSESLGALDFARARGSWLAVTFADLLVLPRETEVGRCVVDCAEPSRLADDLIRAVAVLEDEETRTVPTIAAASIWMWNLGLSLGRRSRYGSAEESAARITLFDSAVSAILIADEIRSAARAETTGAFDFIRDVLAIELASAALGALCMAQPGHAADAADAAWQHCSDELAEVIELANSNLGAGLRFVATTTVQELARQVHQWMHHGATMWRRFGLDALSILQRLRSAHLRHEFDSDRGSGSFIETAHALSEGFGSSSSTQFQVELARGSWSWEGKQLRQSPLRRASGLAIAREHRTSFDPSLVPELAAILALNSGGFPHGDEEMCAAGLVDGGGSDPSPLASYLEALPLPIAIMLAEQALAAQSAPQFKHEASIVVEDVANRCGGERGKMLGLELRLARQTSWMLAVGTIDVEQVLLEWKDDIASPQFAQILTRIINHGEGGDDLRGVALSLLGQNSDGGQWNS